MGNVNSSFGVEIECVIAIQRGTNPQARPRMFQKSPGKPIMVENDYDDAYWTDPDDPVFPVIRKCIAEALVGHEGDRVITSEAQLLDDQNTWHLSKYARNWVVTRDASVYLDDSYITDDPNMGNFKWIDVEFNSPALRATDASFAEIHRVVTALHEAFWVLAPKSTGLHIHYGRCENWIPVTDLRRIAALLYAADPILTQMHPEHRRRGLESQWCMSNRLYSNLAFGLPAHEAHEFLRVQGGTYVPLELEPETVPESVQSHAETVSRPTHEREDNFISIFKRGSLEGYAFDRENLLSMAWMDDKDRVPGSVEGEPLGIEPAARELLHTQAAQVIAMLMQNGWHGRMAYNFNAYQHPYYGKLIMDPFNQPDPLNQPKRTIEFRQATGTVNPDEIIAHARIVIRLCEYATLTTIEELWKTIGDLTLGEQHGDWYDVFDLLVDLNLVDQARVIQRQIANELGIEIIDEALGLTRDPNAPEPEPEPSKAKSVLGKILSGWTSWISKLSSSEQQPKPKLANTVGRRHRILEEHEGRYEGSSNTSAALLWMELGTEGPILPD